MSTSLHIPIPRHEPIITILKRVVADLQKWLECSWAAGMIPSRSTVVPELNVVCVAGDADHRGVPDLVCPIRGNTGTGLAAIVAVGPKTNGTPYSDEDRGFARALCRQITGLLANDRLARHISDDLRRQDNAQDIYDRLDHCQASHVPGLDYGGECHRGDIPGGDFFDLLPLRDREIVMSIGTVAARGATGNIMLGGALAAVRALSGQGESPARIAAELNRTLWELSPEDSFTSFLCAQVDPRRNQLHYVNAGHEPALLLHGESGRVDRLETTGAVLGLSRRSHYNARTVAFEPGDLLAAFSDGVVEAAGPGGVLRTLREGIDRGVQDLAQHVLEAAESASDRTIVLVRARDVAVRPLRTAARCLELAAA